MRRRLAVGAAVTALLLSACAPAAVVDLADRALPDYAVDNPLPERAEIVVELADDVAVERSRVVDVMHGEIALEHARHLSATLPQRLPFTETERAAADWIVEELHAIGFADDDVHTQTISRKHLAGFQRTALDDLDAVEGPARTDFSHNVVARLQGTGDGVIVVGAHHDSTDSPGFGDNGTGVGLLLETAWRLQGQALPYSVDFVFFGAEEIGFAGSSTFISSMTDSQRDEVVLMVNADGLVDSDRLFFDVGHRDPATGAPATCALADSITDLTEGLDLDFLPFRNGILAPGDNLPFAYAGFTVLNLTGVDASVVRPPSLAGGLFDAGDVRLAQDSVKDTADDAREVYESRWPGRKERAMYAFAVLLERLLLGMPA